ncbi:MAG: hypothetical protein ACFCU1_10085 [Sumerlaeia bacterium]
MASALTLHAENELFLMDTTEPALRDIGLSYNPLPLVPPSGKLCLVLIAIRTYKKGFRDGLSSCVADADALAEVMMASFGVKQEHILKLYDQDATHPVADAGSPDGYHSVFNLSLRQSLQRLAQRKTPFTTSDLFVELYPAVRSNRQQGPQRGVIQDSLHEWGPSLAPTFAKTPAHVGRGKRLDLGGARRSCGHAFLQFAGCFRFPYSSTGKRSSRWMSCSTSPSLKLAKLWLWKDSVMGLRR